MTTPDLATRLSALDMRRNTRWREGKSFIGEWTVIPTEDFVALRNALPALVELVSAAEHVVQLGNQPGMDDEEWDGATTDPEVMLASLDVALR